MATVEDLPTATVTGQYLFVSQDNVDEGTDPNAILVTGYVRFTCSAQPPLLYKSRKLSVIPLVSDAVFDSQGFLIPQDLKQATPEVVPGSLERGIELLADTPEVTPRGFTWNVAFNLREAVTGRVIAIPPFNIALSAGTTVDLTEVMPVGLSNGVPVTQGPPGEPGPTTVIAGTVSTYNELPPAADTPLGTGYIVAFDHSLWVLHSTGWKNVGSLGGSGGSGDSLPAGGTPTDYLRGDGEWEVLDKGAVGLDRVDNTSDLEKPVSTATAAAITDSNDSLRGTITTGLEDKADTDHTHGVADLSDATLVGRNFLKAEDYATARAAIGAGTSNLKLGTTEATAKAGDWVPSYGDITGTVPTAALPPLAVVDTTPVASQAAMLALTAQKGDIAIRTDNGRTYILATEPATTLANWKEIMAAGQVSSVAGRTGIITLTKADVGLDRVDNTPDLLKPVSTDQANAINSITKISVGLGNVDNTADVNKPVSTATQAALNKITAHPLQAWVDVLNNPKSTPAIWVSLGSSTAAGGTTDNFGTSWAGRIATHITKKSHLTAMPQLSTATSRPTSGVHAYSGATGGTASGNYLNATKVANIKTLKPTLITHMVGSNDFSSQIALATYKTNLNNWMTQLQAASPNSLHLFVHQQGRNDIANPGIPWSSYGQAMKEVTDGYANAFFLDADAKFKIGGMASNLMTEPVHMNQVGHRMLADIVAAGMGNPILYGPVELYKAEGLTSMSTTAQTVWATIPIPAAAYPRMVQWASIIYMYGTGTAGSTGPEVGYQANYDDDDSQLGEGFVHRVLQGGLGYAHPYPCMAAHMVDANRAVTLTIKVNANIYASGAASYTEVQATAVPA